MNPIKWTKLDKESNIEFSILRQETGKYTLDCKYNGIRVDIRNYELSMDGLGTLNQLLNDVFMDLLLENSATIAADVKKRKRKKK